MGRGDTGMTAGWTEGKPWEIAWGRAPDGKEQYGSDVKVDGNTGRKAWEIVWGELREEGTIWKRRQGGQMGNRGKWHGESSVGKERYGSNESVDGRETVGNSVGRAPRGRSDTEAMKGWTEGKLWEIARGSSIGKERYGSCERVDGRGTVGNSLGTEGTLWEIAWGELRLEEAI